MFVDTSVCRNGRLEKDFPKSADVQHPVEAARANMEAEGSYRGINTGIHETRHLNSGENNEDDDKGSGGSGAILYGGNSIGDSR
jgi:hypothetical protein